MIFFNATRNFSQAAQGLLSCSLVMRGALLLCTYWYLRHREGAEHPLPPGACGCSRSPEHTLGPGDCPHIQVYAAPFK